MKKLFVLEPKLTDENIVVEFSESFKIDKLSAVHVPNGFLAVVFINEKLLFKITPAIEKKLFDYGKEYLNKDCKIAFIKTKPLPSMAWGFGNIQVNNERLKEAYRVGSNGKYSVDIVEIGKTINSFDNVNITTDMIRSRTISVIKNIGSTVLGSYFAKTNNSVFEISSLTNDLRQELINALNNEIAFTSLGLRLKDLTVDGIFVPEDDLELIRNRINYDDSQPVSQTCNNNIDVDEMYERLSKELTEQIKNEIKDSEARSVEKSKNALTQEMEKKQKLLFDELNGKFESQMEELEKALTSEFDEKLQEMLPLNEKAKESYIKEIKITAENLIKSAKDNDDLIPAAAIIYSNVENNLRTRFNLKYENERFVIDFKEYEEIANKAKIGERYLLKRKNNDGSFSLSIPRVVKYDSNNKPQVVEMTPVVRFIKSGLSNEDTKKATEIWTILNKIRHNSNENEKILQDIFKKANVSRKDYLLNALSFYKNKGLYTKD